MIFCPLEERVRREDCSSVRHDSCFTRWKILIGHTDWQDHHQHHGGAAAPPKYRLHNLPAKRNFQPGVYELGIVKPCVEARRNKGKLRKRDVVCVYLGQAENVRQRLQSYGQGGSHLEGWSGLERWLPEKRIITQFLRQGPRLFSEIFARGYSLAFRWASTESKEAAQDVEQKLLKVFDYAWNKGFNGNRRSVEILTRLEMQSNVTCGTRTRVITNRVKWTSVFKKRTGIKVGLKKPRDEKKKRLKTRILNLIRGLLGLSIKEKEVTKTPAEKRRGCGVQRQRRLLYDVKVEEVCTRRRGQDVKRLSACGVVSKDGVSCTSVPVKGRKRCELHKGLRVQAMVASGA